MNSTTYNPSAASSASGQAARGAESQAGIRQAYWRPVDYLVECRRCGEPDLAWQQSKSSSRWYLCRGRFNRAAMQFECDRRRSHICPAHESDYRETSLPNPRRPDEEVRTLMGQIITRGYHSLAAAHHPDHNGDANIMRQLNEAAQRLREVWEVCNEGLR